MFTTRDVKVFLGSVQYCVGVSTPQPSSDIPCIEGHIFWNELKKRGKNPEDYTTYNEDILYPKWSKEHYKGGIKEYERLERAIAIDEEAAISSASSRR